MAVLTRRLVVLLVIGAAAARASDGDVLGKAQKDSDGGRTVQAALGFYQAGESAKDASTRAKAEYYLAESLQKLGFGFGAFYHYGQILKAGPTHPYYAKAVEGAVAIVDQYRDEVLGPNLLEKSWSDEFTKLPPETLARVDYSVALLSYRAGKYDDAAKLLRGVPASSGAYAKAQYLVGLLQQRKDANAAVKTFDNILQLSGEQYRDLPEVRELTHLALGRTLYALKQYREASQHYAALPRFSRHWDEALFEGAYADLQAGDPGAALGKLHSLHSPHLSDEFAPESQNLAAVIYYEHCLYPQAREAIARFDHDYVPMKEKVKAVLESNPALDEYWKMLEPGDTRLPPAVKKHLQKNERVESMVGYLEKLDAEAARVRATDALSKSALGADLLDLIAQQKALMAQIAGKFIKGRLVDLQRLVETLDADKEIIGFETTKGEKEMLETRFNVSGRLDAQRLARPSMPQSGHEYWPFDGEYWPDEIGYYRYTIKDACPKKEEQP